MIEYNNTTVYEWFNNPFKVDFVSPALNLPPIPVDDSIHLNKIYLYTSDPIPDNITVTSVKYVIMLTTPYNFPQLIFFKYDDPET